MQNHKKQRQKPPKIHLEGVGAFIYCVTTHRYLFLLRTSYRYHGTWGLAGGKVDPGENLLESLYREITEEIGQDLHTSKTIPIEKFTSANGNFSYNTFLLPVLEEFIPILNSEHSGYCWVPLLSFPKPLHPGVWRTINFSEVIEKIQSLEDIFN